MNGCSLPDAVTANISTQLQQALSQLQALVCLRLYGEVAHDSVVQHVSSLTGLQELALVDGIFTTASFQQLPQSLTRLYISWANDDNDDDGGHLNRILSASTAPGLCALTALKNFEVHDVSDEEEGYTVAVELLAYMTSLQLLDLKNTKLGVPGTLSVLTALTKLTSLRLPILDSEVTLLSNADTAAVTASPQLVKLNLSDSWLRADKCQHLFPATRQLLQLTRLDVNIDLIHDGPEASRVAACCPNLASITLARATQRDWVPVADDQFVVDCLVAMLLRWQPPQLQHLNSLTIDLQGLLMPPEVWRALARLTQLQVRILGWFSSS
jgi:hypothetical protein